MGGRRYSSFSSLRTGGLAISASSAATMSGAASIGSWRWPCATIMLNTATVSVASSSTACGDNGRVKAEASAED